jgi:hypothetical protein
MHHCIYLCQHTMHHDHHFHHACCLQCCLQTFTHSTVKVYGLIHMTERCQAAHI